MSLSYCPNCQQSFEPGQKVCGHCGYHLGRADPADGGYRLPAEGSTKKRPAGVTFLALLYGVLGVFPLVYGAALIAMPDEVTRLSNPPNVLRLAGAVDVGAGIGCLAFAFGAWSLKPWARVLGIVVISYGIVSNIVGAATSASAITVGTLVSGGLMIWYLERPHVKEAFGITDAPEEHALGALIAPTAPQGTSARPAPDRGDRTRQGLNWGRIAAIGLVGVYAAGVGSLYAWALSDYGPKPLVTAAPGSVSELCFSDSLLTCDPSSAAPLHPDHLTYRFTGPIATRLDLTISRIEGGQERKVLVVDMNLATLWFGNVRAPGMYGPFSCDPCSERGTYVGRVRDGWTLLAEGFFRT
jgi:hypothetical protein